MRKVQNMMRNVDLVELMLSKLFKGLYYDRVIHRQMFQDVLDFLFYYSLNNPLN
jgi:fido (protein-threonine AMPylation protein)